MGSIFRVRRPGGRSAMAPPPPPWCHLANKTPEGNARKHFLSFSSCCRSPAAHRESHVENEGSPSAPCARSRCIPLRGPSASQMTFEATDLGLGAARLCSLLRPPAGSCSLLRDTTARAGPVPLADELDHVGKRRCADGAAGRCSACRHWRVTSLALGDDQTPRATPPTGGGMEWTPQLK